MRNTLSTIFGLSLLFSAQLTLAQDECQLAITGNDAMQFDLKEMSVSSNCEEITVTLTHTGGLPAASMGHNWVLSETENFQSIANDGISAGLQNRYLKADDQRILAATDIIGGGEETSVTFSTAALTAGNDYTFFCSFPGHSALMKGSFLVTN